MNTPEAVQMRLEMMKKETAGQRERQRRELGTIGSLTADFSRVYRRWRYGSRKSPNIYKIFGSDINRVSLYCTPEETAAIEQQWVMDRIEDTSDGMILRCYALLKDGTIQNTGTTYIRCFDSLLTE
jgi:hypothetical protein